MKTWISIRSVTLGFLAGVVTLVAFAWFFGPKIVSDQEDPLTGRRRFETKWLGATIISRVEENEVSRWADQHSIKGIYPAQYGWSGVSTSFRQWFGRCGIGCGGYGIPHRIFSGEIKLEDNSREEVLQKYQLELVENWKRTHSFLPVMEDWSRRGGQVNSNGIVEEL